MSQMEQGESFRYWGKAKPTSDAGAQFHRLPYHCLDVAAVMEIMVANHIYDLSPLAKELGIKDNEINNLLLFFTALHDLGKFARAFQLLRPDLTIVTDARNPRLFKPYSERHDTLGWVAWLEVRGQCPIPNSDDSFWEHWIKSAVGHHGKPPKEYAANGLDIADCFLPLDVVAALEFTQMMADLFQLEKLNLPKLTKSHRDAIKAYTWQLAGLTVIADWLGSNQNFFKYHDTLIPLPEYWTRIALPSARRAVKDSGLLPNAPAPALAPIALFDYLNAPTPLQQYAHEVLLLDGPQLFLLEDVTGAGKTEAALILVNRLMAAGKARGTYIALPTMATANQMYERVSKTYRRLFAQDATPSLVLAHGARNLMDGFADTVLPESPDESDAYDPNDKSGEDTPASAQCAAWLADSHKKSTLADVGVGTLDQALMAALPVKHQSLRLFGLAHKVLIVDEAHAYDPYTTYLLERLVHFHARQGGSAIVLSATLPSTLRAKFVRAFQKGLAPAQEPAALACDMRYPLATQIGCNTVNNHHCQTRPHLTRRVEIAWLGSEETVVEKILNESERGNAVCWIRNTVTEARLAYQALKDHIPHDKLHLFHARFPMGHRLAIEDKVKRLFGNKSQAAERTGQVLIATQVVEQSLDLDFDLLISDLAPIDLLIQRAGRLHRHTRMENGDIAPDNVERRAAPVLHIFAPEYTNEPSANWYSSMFKQGKYVYPNVGQLWLTQRALFNAGAIDTPGTVGAAPTVRSLVEAIYGEEADQIPPTLLPASGRAEGKAKSAQGIASFNALDVSKPYSRASGDWDDDVRIATRLGEDARLVYLAKIENGVLKPLLDVPRHAWAMSAARIEKRKLVDLSSAWQAKHIAAIEHLRQSDRLFTDYDIILPMEINEDRYRYAECSNPEGKAVQVIYNPDLGLIVA